LKLEEKDGELVLEHHAVATPSTFEFSALKSQTQNLQYKGKLFLTNRKLLIFRGYEFKDCEPFSDSTKKAVKYTLKPRRINLKIPLSEIRDLEIGHDEIFGRRHQIYPKLMVTLKNKTWYFILVSQGLTSQKDNVQKDSEEFKQKIEELKKGKKAKPKKVTKTREKKVTPAKVVKPKPTIARPKKPAVTPASADAVPVATVVENKSALQEGTTKLSNIEKLKQQRMERMKAIEAHKTEEKTETKPVAEKARKPTPQPIEKTKSVKEILDERTEEARKKVPKMPTVAPYQATAKAYTPVAQTYKKAALKEEGSDFTDRILDDVVEAIDVDVLDYELNSSYADSSINRCPNCGWMLAWNAKKCPKCKKKVLF